MSARVLRGTKQQIVDHLARISGEVREAIVFVDEPPVVHNAPSDDRDDPFAEMAPFMVDVADIDDLREAIYTRMGGE